MRHGANVKVKRCSSEGCTNHVVKGGVCRRHGAKAKQCSSEGCTNNALTGGVCRRHGSKVKLCSIEGCTKQEQRRGLCIKHGAKVEHKLCSSNGCTNHAKCRGVCRRHGAYRTPNDESTAFKSSEFDETTATLNLPHPNTVDALGRRSSSVPGEVVICREIVEV